MSFLTNILSALNFFSLAQWPSRTLKLYYFLMRNSEFCGLTLDDEGIAS